MLRLTFCMYLCVCVYLWQYAEGSGNVCIVYKQLMVASQSYRHLINLRIDALLWNAISG